MELTEAISTSIERSVLCWLATADHYPNVSPKEIFCAFGDEQIIIANIASPQSVKNIRVNPRVCVSFIDVLVQKGFQLKGEARIVEPQAADFSAMEQKLLAMTGGAFPFRTITAVTIKSAKPIVAPRYLLYPETTEAAQIASAREIYGL